MRERMGSGGPRGLQILRSGACVRGGFDSHAFPPFLLAALAAACIAAGAGPAGAKPATPDSVARAGAPGRPSWTGQPRFVMLRSLLVPGWGQAHNRAWFKALGVAGAEGWLASGVLRDRRDLDGLLGEVNAAQAAQDPVRYAEAVNRYNARLDRYVGRQWMLGGVLAYALVDAYVDAHFRDFDIEFRHDPALPEQPSADPDAPTRGAPERRGGTRVALRWHF